MGNVFKPKGPSAEEIARANAKAKAEAEAAAERARQEAESAAQAQFASSEERKRQAKRTGRRKLIATPFGYLGDESDFGGKGSLLG